MAILRNDTRRAQRVAVNIPAAVQVLGHSTGTLHPNLAKVYERVQPAAESVGQSFPAVIKDLSTNGAFLTGRPLPLLSRLAFRFHLDDHGDTDVIGWVMWRRTDKCSLPRDSQDELVLDPGFGLLFEAMPLGARVRIDEIVRSRSL